MNWVGGSRSRLVMRNDAKKQREFFEKKKMQQKLKSLGLAVPESPQSTSSGSMDLVTLFIVNQIAAKKEIKDPPKMAVLGSGIGGSKLKRGEPLVLPMSPCSPSQLILAEGQPQHSVQGAKKRKHLIPQGFKCRQLSPVLESAFSDNSAPDYLPPMTDHLSPFSTSSASSGQGMFHLNLQQRSQTQAQPSIHRSPQPWSSSGLEQTKLSPVLESAFSDLSAPDYLPPMTDHLNSFSTSSASSRQGMFHMNLQQRSQTQAQPSVHHSPPPWSSSGLEQTKFQPFSQSRSMTDSIPWSCASVPPPLYQLKTPTAAQVLFSPEPDHTEARDRARHDVTFSLSQSESKEPMLDFTLNQSETEHPFQGNVFRGFSTDECEEGASGFGRGKSKIYLKDETPGKCSTPQTVPDSECMGFELSNCTDMDFSCHEQCVGPLNGCDYSPSYSPRGGYLSSDSDDNEECCEPCPQATSSYIDQACCVNSLNQNIDSQENPIHSYAQPRPVNLLLKPEINFRDDQKVNENVSCLDQALGSNSHQMGSNTAQKISRQTQDSGTQTVEKPKTRDASTQCSLIVDGSSKATAFSLSLPPVVVSVLHPATGRQPDTATEAKTHSPITGMVRNGVKHTPWSEKKSMAGSLSGSSIIKTFTAKYSDGKVILPRPINPFLDVLGMTDGKGNAIREDGDDRGQQENGCLTKDLSNQVREEVTSAAGVNRLSEESETLQEIADILLLLKQRKEEAR